MAISAGSDILASDFVSTSAGAGDSGKVAKLNSLGRIPSAFNPFFEEYFGSGADGAATMDGANDYTSLGIIDKKLTIALPTNPTNGQTATIVINGTSINVQFVTSIGSTAGNILIAGTAAGTAANLNGLLNAPGTTNSTQVALSGGNQTLIGYTASTVSTTTITMLARSITLQTLTGSTNVTSGTVTAGVNTTYTLTRDVYFTNLTVSSGITLFTNNWRIFGTGTLTNNGTIHCNGNNGFQNVGGSALPAGYFNATGAGGAGSVVSSGPNSGTASPSTITHSIGANGAAGDLAASSFTAASMTPKLGVNIRLGMDSSVSGMNIWAGGGGGGGSSGGYNSGLNALAGGGGGGAGVVYIAFFIVINNSGKTISANGGVGGNGGDNTGGNAWGPGGGGGGGGCVIIITTSYTNSGTVSANGGVGGNHGQTGVPQTSGSTGYVYQFNI